MSLLPLAISALGGARDGAALVLAYHAVSPSWPSQLAVTPLALKHQVELLLRRGYRFLTFAEAQEDPGPDVAVITFDDAYRSVVDLALPVLEAYEVPATLFVPTGFVSTGRPMAWPGIDGWLESPYEDELLPTTWEDLRGLVAAGWEIGSHAVTHPRLPDLGDERLTEELHTARLTCERELGVPCPSIAYPYGAVDDRVVHAAAGAGYVHGAALSGRAHTSSPLLRQRVGVYRRDGPWRFRAKVAPMVLALRRTPVWSALQRVRPDAWWS